MDISNLLANVSSAANNPGISGLFRHINPMLNHLGTSGLEFFCSCSLYLFILFWLMLFYGCCCRLAPEKWWISFAMWNLPLINPNPIVGLRLVADTGYQSDTMGRQ